MLLDSSKNHVSVNRPKRLAQFFANHLGVVWGVSVKNLNKSLPSIDPDCPIRPKGPPYWAVSAFECDRTSDKEILDQGVRLRHLPENARNLVKAVTSMRPIADCVGKNMKSALD